MGPGRPPLYGLDIETDTAAGGLDPGRAAVVAVAVSRDGHGQVVLTGAETAILAALDAHLAELGPGVLVTWNGGAFDLPFLATRAAGAGVHLGLELAWDPSAYRAGRPPLPGHVGSYAATWHGHAHLDAYRAWRRLSDPHERCGLKAVARSLGLEVVEVDDPGAIHRLALGDLRRYVASDALLARRLAELRWADLRRFVDRMPPGGQLALAPCAPPDGHPAAPCGPGRAGVEPGHPAPAGGPAQA